MGIFSASLFILEVLPIFANDNYTLTSAGCGNFDPGRWSGPSSECICGGNGTQRSLSDLWKDKEKSGDTETAV